MTDKQPEAGPKKWAPEEVEDGERGIRWVTNEGIHGRPTDHDVREYLKRTPTANGCLCDECTVFYAAAPTARPTPTHLEAMERAWLWMENQADGQSKGGHATFDLMMLREERDALRAAIDVAAPPTAQAGGWRPIETAPEGQMVVVGWLDKEDTETPERHDFDSLEDGCWQRWHDHAEHVQIIGGHGVSYTAPYTVWMPIGAIPPTSAEGVEHG